MLKVVSPYRLAVLGKLNNFVKEWIAEISELKVCCGEPLYAYNAYAFKLKHCRVINGRNQTQSSSKLPIVP